MPLTLGQKLLIIAEVVLVGLLLSCIIMFVAVSAPCRYDLSWYIPSLLAVSVVALLLSLCLLVYVVLSGLPLKLKMGSLFIAPAFALLFSVLMYNKYSERNDPNDIDSSLTMTPAGLICISLCLYELSSYNLLLVNRENNRNPNMEMGMI